MNRWFPFNSYDLYAYLTSGSILIAGVDFAFGGETLINKPEWRVVDGVFWVTMSYLVGHIVSGLSEPIFQRLVVHRFLFSPAYIILNIKAPRMREIFFQRFFAREYNAFSLRICELIVLKIRNRLQSSGDSEITSDEVYNVTFSNSVYNENSNIRIEQFKNLYGMCRNVSFSSLLSSIIIMIGNISIQQKSFWFVIICAGILSFGMFGRYIKFYSAYTREILRSFNSSEPVTQPSQTSLAPPSDP